MLVQFSVKNFKSIKDEVTLDMQAASISEHEESLLSDKTDEKFLPVAAIYGPNGGGKSNVLEALDSLIEKIRLPVALTLNPNAASILTGVGKNEIVPYMFSKDSRNNPTDFELYFRTEHAEYKYNLSIKQNKILYESFAKLNFETNRTSLLFERRENVISLKGDFSKLKIATSISDELPLLSYLGFTYRNNEIINDTMKVILTQFGFADLGNPFNEAVASIIHEKHMKTLLLNSLKEMDIDIEDFRIDQTQKNIYTKHIVNGLETEILLNNESSGTKKLFAVVPGIILGLESGASLIIDELDAKLHPVLLKYIINLFTNPQINRHNAQLIFTSHDLSTMNNEVFRRDEIWFVAKGNEQNSQLYSLIEFKDNEGKSIRKDAKYDKQYLEGKYGADPYLKKIIDWESVYGEK